jgi:hypothetical protein|tara:strand:+ start:770 stop:955 length:186 start_codon:yes stop_codon:yes gene_type:complete
MKRTSQNLRDSADSGAIKAGRVSMNTKGRITGLIKRYLTGKSMRGNTHKQFDNKENMRKGI